MRPARLRGAALAGAIALVLLSSFCAAAEPLRLVAVAASVAFDARTGRPVLTIRLADESKQSFAAFSQAHLGQMIDTRIDGKTVLKPVMREPIPGGSLQVTMDSVEEARRLADRLSSGATASRGDLELTRWCPPTSSYLFEHRLQPIASLSGRPAL